MPVLISVCDWCGQLFDKYDDCYTHELEVHNRRPQTQEKPFCRGIPFYVCALKGKLSDHAVEAFKPYAASVREEQLRATAVDGRPISSEQAAGRTPREQSVAMRRINSEQAVGRTPREHAREQSVAKRRINSEQAVGPTSTPVGRPTRAPASQREPYSSPEVPSRPMGRARAVVQPISMSSSPAVGRPIRTRVAKARPITVSPAAQGVNDAHAAQQHKERLKQLQLRQLREEEEEEELETALIQSKIVFELERKLRAREDEMMAESAAKKLKF